MLKLLFFIFFLITAPLRGLDSIDNLLTFTQTHDEYPEADNDNIANLRYTNFYKKSIPTFWKRFLARLGLATFDAQQYYLNLKEITEKRLKEGLRKRHTRVLKVPAGTQFLIISNTQGDLHSLTRIFNALYQNHIIDQNFKILSTNLYLIFNGNMTTSSPYALESLNVIINILKANPGHAFFIKGTYSDKEQWKTRALGYQVDIRLSYFKDAPSVTREFFNTLPLGIYILSEDPNEPPIRISHYDLSAQEFNNLECSLKSPHTSQIQEGICLVGEPTAPPQGPLTALIAGKDDNVDLSNSRGLLFVQRENPPTWKVFSSPSRYYRQKFGFIYDAFGLLTIGKSVKSSFISLFNENVLHPGFKLAKTYSIVTGKPLTVPQIKGSKNWQNLFQKLSSLAKDTNLKQFQHKQVLTKTTDSHPQKTTKGIVELGSSVDLSRSLKNLGRDIRIGISLALNGINQSGGINGKSYQVTILDDQYTPLLTRKNVDYFLKKGISLILIPTGSPTLEACLDLIKNRKILVLFPTTGADLFRKPELEYIVHFRKSNRIQAKIVVEHLVKQSTSLKKFAFFYQNDLHGNESLKGALESLKKARIKNWVLVPYTSNTLLKIPEAAETIRKANPDAIGLFSTLPPAIELLRQLGGEFLEPKMIFTNSTLGEKSFREFLDSLGLKATIAQVTPNPQTSSLEIVKEYRNEIVKKGFKTDPYSLEGYIATQLTADFL